MQHLEIFAAFKGVAADLIPAAVEKMVGLVGLKEKRGAKSAMLSGGQKQPSARLPFCCTPPLPLAGVSVVMERERQRNWLGRRGSSPSGSR